MSCAFPAFMGGELEVRNGSCERCNRDFSDAQSVSPASVQLKGEINGALPRKRHQQRHLEFCIA